MTKWFSIIVLILLIACNNDRQKLTNQRHGSQSSSVIDSSVYKNSEKDFFVLRGSYENSLYKVEVLSHFLIPAKIEQDSSYYFRNNLLSVKNKNTNQNYKVQITDPCSDDAEILIHNVTDSLGFNQPLFEITTPDCDDWQISEFIQLKNDSLQKLFEISDSKPAKLSKTNQNSLVGTVLDRDELVGDFQDYPVTVSLFDYSVKETKPLRQRIGFKSEALENIQGYRVSNNGEAKKTYLIRKGQKLTVDSLFRDTKQVLLRVQDTILVICPIIKAKDKLQSNTAG